MLRLLDSAEGTSTGGDADVEPILLASNLESIVLAQLEDGTYSLNVEYMFSLLFSVPPSSGTNFVASIEKGDVADDSEDTAVTIEKQNDLNSFPGILHFFVSSYKNSDKDIIKSKVALLKLIALIVKIVNSNNQLVFDGHRLVIFNVLVDVFKKENAGDIRATCLQPLKNIIRGGKIVDMSHVFYLTKYFFPLSNSCSPKCRINSTGIVV